MRKRREIEGARLEGCRQPRARLRGLEAMPAAGAFSQLLKFLGDVTTEFARFVGTLAWEREGVDQEQLAVAREVGADAAGGQTGVEIRSRAHGSEVTQQSIALESVDVGRRRGRSHEREGASAAAWRWLGRGQATADEANERARGAGGGGVSLGEIEQAIELLGVRRDGCAQHQIQRVAVGMLAEPGDPVGEPGTHDGEDLLFGLWLALGEQQRQRGLLGEAFDAQLPGWIAGGRQRAKLGAVQRCGQLVARGVVERDAAGEDGLDQRGVMGLRGSSEAQRSGAAAASRRAPRATSFDGAARRRRRARRPRSPAQMLPRRSSGPLASSLETQRCRGTRATRSTRARSDVSRSRRAPPRPPS